MDQWNKIKYFVKGSQPELDRTVIPAVKVGYPEGPVDHFVSCVNMWLAQGSVLSVELLG